MASLGLNLGRCLGPNVRPRLMNMAKVDIFGHSMSVVTLARPTNVSRFVDSAQPWTRHYASVTSPLQKRETFDVTPFGKLTVKPSKHLDLKVSPLNPQVYLSQDKVFVDVGNSDVNCWAQEDDVFIESGDSGSAASDLTHCQVQVPVRFNLDLHLEGQSSIEADTLENSFITVSTDTGNCYLKEMKTNALSVSSGSGNVKTDGLLQGNARIQTLSGRVDIHKTLCQKLVLESQSGDLCVTSLYADQSQFTSQTGDVNVGSGHRNVTVDITEKGDLKIDTLDGSLVARVAEGSVDVHITQHQNVGIRVGKGDITLRLPASLKSSLKLKANNIDIDNDVLDTAVITRTNDGQGFCLVSGIVGGTDGNQSTLDEPIIAAETNDGTIRIRCQDWLSTLKLGRNFRSEND